MYRIQHTIKSTERKLSNTVRCHTLFKMAFTMIDEKRNKTRAQVRLRLEKKITNLTGTQISTRSDEPGDYNSWLVNLTDKVIPIEVENILKLEPKFCFVPNKIPIHKIITDVEFAIMKSNASVTEKEKTRNLVANHKENFTERKVIPEYY